MRRVRWECPKGAHSGQLGPSRPSRLSLVRYCLECSEEAGKLVERVAPALKRLREARAQGAANRAFKKAQRVKERAVAMVSAHGMNMQAELERLFSIAKRVLPADWVAGKSMPSFHIRRCSCHPRSRIGSYWYGPQRIIVATYPGRTLAGFLETLAHELAHHIAGREGGGGHSLRWRTCFRLLLEHGYGVRVAIDRAGHGGYLEGKIPSLPGASIQVNNEAPERAIQEAEEKAS